MSFENVQPVAGQVVPVVAVTDPTSDHKLVINADGSINVTGGGGGGGGSVTQGTSPWVVSAASLPLPTGASTSALQTTGNASLVSIDGKITAVNTGAVAFVSPQHVIVDTAPTTAVTNANLDVALSTRLKPADTLAAVTTVGTITNVVHVDDNAGSLTVDGAVTVSQATGTNLHVVVDTAPTTAVTNAGLSNLDVALSTRLKPADTLTGVTTLGTITNVVHIDDNAGSLTVDGTVAVSNFPATQPVSGSVSVSNFPATQPISAAALPLPTGAATETGNLLTIATQTQNNAQIIDALNCIIAQLKLLNMNFAACSPSAHTDLDTWLMDTLPALN